MAAESTTTYEDQEPTREEIDRTQGPVLLEFGTAWCGYCRAAQPLIAEVFQDHADVRHLKIEDGKVMAYRARLSLSFKYEA